MTSQIECFGLITLANALNVFTTFKNLWTKKNQFSEVLHVILGLRTSDPRVDWLRRVKFNLNKICIAHLSDVKKLLFFCWKSVRKMFDSFVRSEQIIRWNINTNKFILKNSISYRCYPPIQNGIFHDYLLSAAINSSNMQIIQSN